MKFITSLLHPKRTHVSALSMYLSTTYFVLSVKISEYRYLDAV